MESSTAPCVETLLYACWPHHESDVSATSRVDVWSPAVWTATTPDSREPYLYKKVTNQKKERVNPGARSRTPTMLQLFFSWPPGFGPRQGLPPNVHTQMDRAGDPRTGTWMPVAFQKMMGGVCPSKMPVHRGMLIHDYS